MYICNACHDDSAASWTSLVTLRCEGSSSEKVNAKPLKNHCRRSCWLYCQPHRLQLMRYHQSYHMLHAMLCKIPSFRTFKYKTHFSNLPSIISRCSHAIKWDNVFFINLWAIALIMLLEILMHKSIDIFRLNVLIHCICYYSGVEREREKERKRYLPSKRQWQILQVDKMAGCQIRHRLVPVC